MMRKPEALLAAVKPRLEHRVDVPIDLAFPVLLRRSLTHILVPAVAAFSVLGLISVVSDSEAVTGLMFVLMGVFVVFCLIYARNNNEFGVVAVTRDEFILFAADKRSLDKLVLEARLPRDTPLPPARYFKHQVSGGPLPIPVRSEEPRRWFYTGESTLARRDDYLSLINDLRAQTSSSL